jgi:hypothetical protein
MMPTRSRTRRHHGAQAIATERNQHLARQTAAARAPTTDDDEPPPF